MPSLFVADSSRPSRLLGGVRLLVGALAVLLLTVLVPAPPVAAHGELVGASPGPGETVGRAAHIDLLFSTGVSDWQLTVERPSGEPLDGMAVQKADQLLSFETPALSQEGQYIVRYSGFDSDGDVIEGAYAFVFEAGAAPPADLPIDLSLLEDDSWPLWMYGILMGGVVVIAVLAGLLAEKLRRLRAAVNG